MNARRILFVSAEVAPFAKAGGLADVVGSLPKALVELGLDVRVVMPNYRGIDPVRFPRRDTGQRFTVPFDGIDHVVRVFSSTLPGTALPIFFLDHPHYEGVGDIYYQDITNPKEQQVLQTERFLFFAKAVTTFLETSDWQPNVVHCHDWHTAAIPFLLKGSKKTLYTIHNLPLQGALPMTRFVSLLGCDPTTLPERAIMNGNINLTALGLLCSDALTTVSPTYAKEILTAEQGGGLEDILQQRHADLHGILNGIDETLYGSAPEKKTEHTKVLRAYTKLRDGGPLFGLVSRLTEQKGISLVCDILEQLVHLGGKVVVLGRGEAQLEQRLLAAARHFPGEVSVATTFSDDLARMIYAGSHFFLMPSRFEPCGLGQMIAMRYGTIPIVRHVGGLADTVRDNSNGFTFTPFTASAFREACARAMDAYRNEQRFQELQHACFQTHFPWHDSAQQYAALYSSLTTYETK